MLVDSPCSALASIILSRPRTEEECIIVLGLPDVECVDMSRSFGVEPPDDHPRRGSDLAVEKETAELQLVSRMLRLSSFAEMGLMGFRGVASDSLEMFRSAAVGMVSLLNAHSTVLNSE